MGKAKNTLCHFRDFNAMSLKDKAYYDKYLVVG